MFDSSLFTSSASRRSSVFALVGAATSEMLRFTYSSSAPARDHEDSDTTNEVEDAIAVKNDDNNNDNDNDSHHNDTDEREFKYFSLSSIRDALEIARDDPMRYRETNPSASNILEKALARIWRQIEANPNTYVMTEDEFSVFNYFRARFNDESTRPLAAAATARYWDCPQAPPNSDRYHGDERSEGSPEFRERNS